MKFKTQLLDDKAIARAQKKVENHNFDIRKHLLEYDDVLNRQREIIYKERDKILKEKSIRDMIYEFLEEVIENKVLEYCDGKNPEHWDLTSLEEWLKHSLNLVFDLKKGEWEKADDPQLEIFKYILDHAKKHYEQKIQMIGEEEFSYLEKRITLDIIDNKWKEHLHHLLLSSGWTEREVVLFFYVLTLFLSIIVITIVALKFR